jgi:cyclic pyranopterin phosphate synthase
MRSFNDDEICDFVQLTKDRNLDVRFIEYMPFTGNKWNDEKMVPYHEVVQTLKARWPEFHTLPNGPNDTSKVGIIITYNSRQVLLNVHSYSFITCKIN